ncbi:MAG: hypothetical protein MPEBLZ_01435 [Candidatus Methanoperedens nitroreducens]|uniref:Uncharacterized protein n=1 Tax=Candidatus Methanoperedens nitratireducens TaxID=1392998 RepID=A0A0P8E196_9EURY|nr:MAG: hypothetical protein MPEBLZ_01435 [Candidatus Methanoperedens sp. BLZ1]
MIRIDSENKKIHFFIPYNIEEENAPPQTFDLISAYVCPICNKILRAYYIGIIPKEAVNNYIEKNSINNLPEMGLAIGNAGGGQYLKNTSHFDKYSRSSSCKWEEIPFRGVKTCLEALFEKLDRQHTGYAVPEKLIELVNKNQFEGILLVPDVCGKDLPMLIYNENVLSGIGQRTNIDFKKEWQLRESIIKFILEKIGIIERNGNQ